MVCVSVGIIAGFFTGGVPGAIYASSCTAANTYTAHQADLACKVAGAMKKESCDDAGLWM